MLILPVILCFLSAAVNTEAHADSLINLSVKASNTEPGIGDVLTISVTADNFPSIISFGPMKIHYDAQIAEYLSIDMGSEISSFVYNTTQDDNFVNVTAFDQYYQETGNEDGAAVESNVAYSSDSQMVLFSVNFRIRQDASGQIPFWIEDAGEFRDANGEEISTVVDNSISVTISDKVSDDANLVLLSINNAVLEPSFSPDVTEYSAVVERAVTDVPVTANASNLWASIIISGNNNLQIGNNQVTVTVTAQDGVTTKEYHVNLVRKESYVPENAVVADYDGNSYTFLDFPQGFTAPEGFSQKIKNINNFPVPVYSRDGVSSVLVYLYDGENPPGLYLYNSDLKTVMPYSPEKTLVRKSSILILADMPEDLKIPKDFTAANEEIDGKLFIGYRDSEDQFVCYLMDETGTAGFYSYDSEDNMFRRYVPVDRTAEKAYSALLMVFMIVAAVEAVFIVVIVIVVHRVMSHRNNPRPRRV